MMEKNFDVWNERKKMIHHGEPLLTFYEREVWWCRLGLNIGVEIDGKHESFQRPVIILHKFNRDMALIVPVTGKDKTTKFYVKVSGEDGKTYTACLSHLKTLSFKRLIRKIGIVVFANSFSNCSMISFMSSVGIIGFSCFHDSFSSQSL